MEQRVGRELSKEPLLQIPCSTNVAQAELNLSKAVDPDNGQRRLGMCDHCGLLRPSAPSLRGASHKFMLGGKIIT